eukprot:CAMPEP_0197433728 /NCGR_PEP_ID=MMETSP1175-20131217/1562_1 /TAXON_ID=1003142 /ORGANISM="Triceratium dubium, Strain CCMP147" /LENGTH=156 /DNA_ID=CAMNT_0042962205 /DNA_START=242 /DNA_END=712 /DNA_ORIENTATION=-
MRSLPSPVRHIAETRQIVLDHISVVKIIFSAVFLVAIPLALALFCAVRAAQAVTLMAAVTYLRRSGRISNYGTEVEKCISEAVLTIGCGLVWVVSIEVAARGMSDVFGLTYGKSFALCLGAFMLLFLLAVVMSLTGILDGSEEGSPDSGERNQLLA